MRFLTLFLVITMLLALTTANLTKTEKAEGPTDQVRVWPPGRHPHPWWPRPYWPRFACPIGQCYQVCDQMGCDCDCGPTPD